MDGFTASPERDLTYGGLSRRTIPAPGTPCTADFRRELARRYFSNSAIDSTCAVCGNMSIAPAATSR
jgi:hypothetical protein